MGASTSERERQQFYLAHQAGASYGEIAQRYGVSTGCVRTWCRRQAAGGGVVSPTSGRPPGLLNSFAPIVRYVILRLRLAHPRWGPSRLRYHLRRRPTLAGLRLPSETSIWRYLRQWPKLAHRPKPPHPPSARPPSVTTVHECWQLDFKLEIAVADGQLVNLHTVRDVVSGLCVAARFTPAGQVGRRARRVTQAEVQASLRQGFARWQSLPQAVQTDNEGLFVGRADDTFPSHFTLWLVGLGIGHRTIRPGRPTDNACVERTHRLLCDYVLAGQEQQSLATLQQRLEQALDELAFDLPSRAQGCGGLPPVEAHPELLTPSSPFLAHCEVAHFDLGRVDAYLASFRWRRKVGETGQLNIGGHHHAYSVGRKYAQQAVLVCFDPKDRSFVFFADGPASAELGRRPARHLAAADILGLNLADNALGAQQLPLPFPPSKPSTGFCNISIY
jgi:transposase InsO family protein